ncbi:MAG: serine hydrolase [Bacteroidales bacterium]|nr:serine hydrolase [Bacteroidales bacterium]
MLKKWWLIILVVFLLIFGFAAKYIIDRSMIFTGFAAKNLASGIFVADRTQEDLEANDLNFSLVGLASSTVDYKNKVVYSDFYGFGKQKAFFREGLGVCLQEDDLYPNAVNDHQTIKTKPAGFDTIAWPRGDKMQNDLSSVFDMQALQIAIDAVFEKGRTRSVIVAYDTLGMIEQYAEGFTKHSKILGWSMSKSIASTMIGILSKHGKIDINKSAPIEEWAHDERRQITTKNLLNMTSGIQWDEDYGDISEATVMLYQKSNHAQFAINQPAAYPPDSVWYYSSGSSNILTEIVKRTINNDQAYWQFPYKELFYKISMYETLMETDASGNFVGSSYTYATSRDWARFGLLYLQNGIWFGDTIVEPSWVAFTQTEAPHSKGDYGSQFWLNKSKRELPDAPEDLYFADGFQGQRIYIIPSKKLVIVRMGLTTEKDFDYNKMVTDVIKALK